MQYNLTILFLLLCLQSFNQTTPSLRKEDALRIREALMIATKFGEQLFEGYSKVPFAILLVTDSTEFLINHPNPSADFSGAGEDSLLHTQVYYRKRVFSPNLLATFPAVNGLSCIVVGTPENTKKSSMEWIITLLHEHFHQYQSSAPSYYQSVSNLGLSGGDQTGVWMLNYLFPYDSLPVKNQYALYTKALHKAVASIGSSKFNANLKDYFREREKLKAILSSTDYRYFSFQLWQEGLARYTEYKFLGLLAQYTHTKEITDLPDFASFASLMSKMYREEMNNLIQNRLQELRRVSFYTVGFAEGLLLDEIRKSWRNNYLTDRFYIEHYFK